MGKIDFMAVPSIQRRQKALASCPQGRLEYFTISIRNSTPQKKISPISLEYHLTSKAFRIPSDLQRLKLPFGDPVDF
jgi:hypothetical protein